jgi:hypothetical protein
MRPHMVPLLRTEAVDGRPCRSTSSDDTAAADDLHVFDANASVDVELRARCAMRTASHECESSWSVALLARMLLSAAQQQQHGEIVRSIITRASRSPLREKPAWVVRYNEERRKKEEGRSRPVVDLVLGGRCKIRSI